MSQRISVRCIYGAWQRTCDGKWIFKRKPSDLGYTVSIKPTETFENMVLLIRDRYKFKSDTPLSISYRPPPGISETDETRTPPVTVTTTSDVERLMQIRSSFAELKLCVSSGPEDVAHFEFLTNTPFHVGGAAFEFNGLTDRAFVASKSVLEEIFTEKELVRIYRASFEIGKKGEEIREEGVSCSDYGAFGSNEDFPASPDGSAP